MPEIDEARYQAVYQYILSQGSQVQSWPNTASIIAMAIEVALNFKQPTEGNDA